jgi:hypothetical protein
MQNEHARMLKELIEQDSPTLYSAPSSYLVATAPAVGNGEQYNGMDTQTIRTSIRKAFNEFETQIASEGQLTQSGRQKLQRLALANPDIAFTQSEAWYQSYLLLYHAGELLDQGDSDSSDFIVNEVAEPEANPLDRIESLDLSTREGDAVAKKIVANAVFGSNGEARAIYTEWLESLRSNFGYEMPPDVQRQALDLFRKNNWSYIDRRAFDLARLNLVNRNIMPPSCKTPTERLNDQIETADDRTWEGRRRLRQQILDAQRKPEPI